MLKLPRFKSLTQQNVVANNELQADPTLKILGYYNGLWKDIHYRTERNARLAEVQLIIKPIVKIKRISEFCLI